MPSADVNWKLKYQELKMKFMSSVDVSFRLGFEAGAQQAQVQSAQDQAQQAQEQQAQGQEGQPQEGEQPEQGQEQAPPESAHPGGSELDQHINELSSMLGKSELTGDDLVALKKSFGSLKASVDLAKSQAAIASISKSLKLSKNTLAPIKHAGVANMTPVAKKALNMQEKIVEEMMDAWSKESADAKTDIMSILKR